MAALIFLPIQKADDRPRAIFARPSRARRDSVQKGRILDASVSEALQSAEVDLLVDYTSAAAVRGNVDAALAGGANVVVGSSGLSEADYAELDAAARRTGDDRVEVEGDDEEGGDDLATGY